MSAFPLFNVVLVHPEIPSNTGNIGRTCVGYYCRLHLVKPLGFEINNRQLKRAGLDYWPNLKYRIYKHWKDITADLTDQRVFYLSTKGQKNIYDCYFKRGDWFVFGSESRGLGSLLYKLKPEQVLAIPTPGPVRSLNLSNAVGITVFEAYRQISQSGSAVCN